MTRTHKLLSLVLALALLGALFGLVGCGGSDTSDTKGTETEEPAAPAYKLVNEGKLTVGSDLDYPPFEQLNGSTPEGFDVELMTAIAKEMGLEINYLPPQSFDALPALVNAGETMDVIASAMTINEERKKLIVFSDPYFESNEAIVMAEGGTYTAPADLAGKKVGVQSGTTNEEWANEYLKPAGAEVVPFKKNSEAVAALQAGNVQAVACDLPTANEILKDESKKLVIAKQIATGEQYGFGIAMENPELATAINEALQKVKDSGEYKTIYEKWIGPME